MLRRISAIALNTYREAVRARVLHGLFALALATGGYSLVVGVAALRDTLRVVSDLGAASISFYAILVAVVLGATSLYRELELKTIFPILARPLRRSEYLTGKYLGTVLTLFAFITANAGALLLSLGAMAGARLALVAGSGLGSLAVLTVVGWRVPRLRSYLPIVWGIVLLVAGASLSGGAPDDRRVILAASLLALCEVGIVAAIATVFASFSSPFLTAVFTLGVFLVGRSADTLARLPEKMFGSVIRSIGDALSRVVPNLMLYVPPRPLLAGEAAGVDLGSYLLSAAAYAIAWIVGLLAVASIVFRRRDFL
jgi:ABC-type transport system involved in multi-copper enzyme maturation permease subunit